MKFAYYCIAAILAAFAFGGSAGAKPDAHAAAVKACMSADGLQSATFVAAVEDGRGGSLVWLNDAGAALWLCNANEEGKVFALAQMTGDLLEGAGAYLVDSGKEGEGEGDVEAPEKEPVTIAELACHAYLDNEGKVIGSGADGLNGDWVPGFFVFIETGKGLFLCDATADAQVWAVAEIGDPLSTVNPVG
jgi:hypothetical protein